jgi:hypothetical protein
VPGAVRRNILTRQETDDRIENVIKDWLKYASDRDGGRKKRKNAEGNQQEPNVPDVFHTFRECVLSSDSRFSIITKVPMS